MTLEIHSSTSSRDVLRAQAAGSFDHAAMLRRLGAAARCTIDHHLAFGRAMDHLADGQAVEYVAAQARAEMSGWLPYRLESGRMRLHADDTAEMVENTFRRIVRDHGPVTAEAVA